LGFSAQFLGLLRRARDFRSSHNPGSQERCHWGRCCVSGSETATADKPTSPRPQRGQPPKVQHRSIRGCTVTVVKRRGTTLTRKEATNCCGLDGWELDLFTFVCGSAPYLRPTFWVKYQTTDAPGHPQPHPAWRWTRSLSAMYGTADMLTPPLLSVVDDPMSAFYGWNWSPEQTRIQPIV
jgi:hypothetical protein